MESVQLAKKACGDRISRLAGG